MAATACSSGCITHARRYRIRPPVAAWSRHPAGRRRAPGPSDRLRRLDRHVDRPHLHYEFYSKDQPVNPLSQKSAIRAALAGKDLARFQLLTREYINQFKVAPHVADSAPPSAKKPAAAPQIARGG
jgi:hypothetical protein